ncbi:MAG: toxin-activating lysine-acyltransferase [Paracoccaceae bacterium]
MTNETNTPSTANGNADANAVAPDQEVLDKVAALRAHVRESFGKIALSMMALPRYRHHTLADLQHLILDPLIRDRIAIAYPAGSDAKVTDDLTGVAIWASVTPEVDAKIREQIKDRAWLVRLKADEWNGGDITWLIDVIAPSKKATGQVVGNFKTVVKEGELRLHPVLGQLPDQETLEKLDMKRGAKE